MLTQRLIANRYELGDLVGQGGMGAVFRSRDRRTGQQVAVKELRHDVTELDPHILDRFRREAETLRRLDHPGIVRLLDALDDGGRQYLVMEYVPGGSLDALLRRSSIPVRRALEIALDLADALARVHRLGVVHRDIKPANVLLAADGTPRLTDFGAALAGDGARLTETGVMIGTFAYLSPEMCEGAPPDARADIWAFGVLLFEMLAGRRPFVGASTGALLTSILTTPAPDLRALRPDTPPALAELVAAMLEKDRERRIASARLVGATLESILHDLDAAAEATPAIPSRFVAQPADDMAEAPALLSQLLLSPRPPVPSDAPTVTAPAPQWPAAATGTTSRAPPRRPARRWLLGALVAAALVVAALALAPRDDRGAPQVVAIFGAGGPARVDPVADGEHMVLVAQLEQFGGAERDEARFIVDELRRSLEVDAPFSRVRVRSYPRVIASDAEARAAAEANGAALVVWGSDHGDRLEVNVQVGAAAAFPGIALDRALVAQAADVRLTVHDSRRESLAPYVLGALSMLQNADGDVYETARTIAIMGLLRGTPAEPLGRSVAAHYHRATARFMADAPGALAELDQAIALAGGNPILYTSRGLAYQRQGRHDEARRDIETARRLGPPGWAVPRAMFAADAARRGDMAAAIAAYDAIAAQRPQDWFPSTYRGALRYLAGDTAGARADLQQAIALGPRAHEPAALAALVALREGRLVDASGHAAAVVRALPDPALARRIIEAALGAGAQGNPLGPLLSAVTSLAIGQYDQAARDADAALRARPGLPDAYAIRGLAACSLGRYDDAAAAAAAGLAAAPGDALLHLLRADARRRLGDMAGMEEDLAAAAQSAAFAAHADAVRRGALGCDTLLGPPRS